MKFSLGCLFSSSSCTSDLTFGWRSGADAYCLTGHGRIDDALPTRAAFAFAKG